MPSIDDEMDEEMYKETTVLRRRHLTDQVLRVPLKHTQPPEPVCVAPDAQLQVCVEAMRDQSQGCLLICDKDSKKLLGIFTERDLLKRVAGRGWDFRQHRIGDVMTPNPECLTPQDKIGFALNLMMTKGYRHIPILNEKGRPCGIVTVRELLLFLCEHFPEDVINLPSGRQSPADRDGG